MHARSGRRSCQCGDECTNSEDEYPLLRAPPARRARAGRRCQSVRVLPGAKDLLQTLSRLGVPWAIATSGSREGAEQPLKLLGLGKDIPVITRDDVQRAKPDPDLFLAAARKLGTDLENCVVVGDSIWDLLAAQRARALGVGLLSGGFGQDELMNAGAYRVYRDPADLNAHLDEIGIRAGF